MAKNSSEVKRTALEEKTKIFLWGMTAGRCEICNKLLYIDSKFGDTANFAENAHIHAVGKNGPRHVDEMSKEEINKIENLMLLCAEHHHLIDTKPENYPDNTLIDCKKHHEERIRKITEIQDDASCKIVTFFSNIDNVEIFSAEMLLKRAVVKANLYPRQDAPISLDEGSQTRYIPTKENLVEKANELEYQIKQAFNGIVKKNEVIAIFSLAPQTLLFKLGTLISDQLNVQVFQCHREGEKWSWPENEFTRIKYLIKKTCDKSEETVAMVIDLSAQIIDNRVTVVLGDECTIFHLTIESPNRLFVKNKKIQDDFVKSFRSLMEQIKNEYPNADKIHVFPAMPNSLAIRAGMDIMPKVDLPIVIYDVLSAGNEFTETIEIGG